MSTSAGAPDAVHASAAHTSAAHTGVAHVGGGAAPPSAAPVRIRVARRAGTEDLPLPAYMTDGASGMDVHAACDAPIELAPGAWSLVPTGLCLEVPIGYEVQVRARSGLAARHGLVVMNGIGTIDADYRGEVQVILGNLGRAPFEVARGLRVAQLVLARVERAGLEVVDALDESARGPGGFGSTGL